MGLALSLLEWAVVFICILLFVGPKLLPGSKSYLALFLEIRKRLLLFFSIWLIAFVITLFSRIDTLNFLINPILNLLPKGQNLIATKIAAPAIIPIRLAALFSLFVSMPAFLYQLWRFLSKDVNNLTRTKIIKLMLLSVSLFYGAVVFCFMFILPLVFELFIKIAPHGVKFMPDISSYLAFVISLSLSFGLSFEIPIIICMLAGFGWCSVRWLKHQRPYVIVLAFFIGMIFTPPDIISQFLLAVPIWLFYEFGIVVALCFAKRNYSKNLVSQ